MPDYKQVCTLKYNKGANNLTELGICRDYQLKLGSIS